MVYLISPEQAERLTAVRLPVEMADSANLAYAPGSWMTGDDLRRLRPLIPDLTTIAEVEDLPVFFGPLETPDGNHYASMLTALCLARQDGQTIRGLGYLAPYDDYWLNRELGRCFRYGQPGDTQHFWRVIGHVGDVEWLRGYWGEAHGFAEWPTYSGLGTGKHSVDEVSGQ